MSGGGRSYGQDALWFICTMTEKQRHAAVVIFRDVEESIIKFSSRLMDLASFYTREKRQVFNKFFVHDLNSLYYRVKFTSIRLRRYPGSWATKLNWPCSTSH